MRNRFQLSIRNINRRDADALGGSGFGLGPPNSCGSGSGPSADWSFADVSATKATLTFTFFGATHTGLDGSFSVLLDNFGAATDGTTITGITRVSGDFANFDVANVGSGQWNFTGTPDSNGQYYAYGGKSVTFDVSLAPLPVPATGALLLGGLAVFGALRRRKNKAIA